MDGEGLMPKFRRTPIVIEAVQWTGDTAPIIALIGHDLPTYGLPGNSGSIRVTCPRGDHECRLGDWVIKGAMGETYVCERETFEHLYESAEQTPELRAEIDKRLKAFSDAADRLGGFVRRGVKE